MVARSVQNGAPLRRSADSWDPVMEPIRSFQTVSGRRILGSTHKRCCVSPALCRKARPRRPSYDGGRHHPRVPHSPPAGIKAHALREENAHLRHVRGLIRVLRFGCQAGRACIPPPRRPAFPLPAPETIPISAAVVPHYAKFVTEAKTSGGALKAHTVP